MVTSCLYTVFACEKNYWEGHIWYIRASKRNRNVKVTDHVGILTSKGRVCLLWSELVDEFVKEHIPLVQLLFKQTKLHFTSCYSSHARLLPRRQSTLGYSSLLAQNYRVHLLPRLDRGRITFPPQTNHWSLSGDQTKTNSSKVSVRLFWSTPGWESDLTRSGSRAGVKTTKESTPMLENYVRLY